ncbi:ABC transporter substrate-binding protein [Haloferax volcanii]|uniref:ABC-type transport system periplasmic substrate-binding protein n=3 Tax=Haloferax volcanii TaxID=2246 RepID=D4GY90_HALVD|nr:ABC transporter substrate-binding protein [Haloferax volcanii]ADE04812.1 ABC-type transport system periplasmic substrate-binding protein [Haloferax volcanii DS2]ELY28298.1 putative iron-III ABC transporter periplasmic substrate-binding protein [Haloferax volcanii DS2]MBS8117899.1 ABC transporter substrate-binding protein [Haloferax volcanii]MBS8122911.1 ABC transporter substrate-binding protein [Haloferax volcanii]MBS8126779.1 ABC transporter substrate-binding protein [Haloferax volcanii]
MEEKSTGQEGLTRRNYIRYGGTALGAGMLAGCASDSSGSDEATTAAETTTEAATETSAETETQTTEADSSYSVTMEPMGEVTFDSVPESWAAYDGGYADMAVALGVGDGLTGVGGAGRYYTYVYDELPGVSVDREQIEAYPEVRTKEEFYELDNDVHLYDPNMLINWFDWDQADVDEIAENVAPFVGNLVFRRSDGWHDYRYYTLYEAFEKVAQVFQREDRYEAFEAFHDEFIAEIQAELPPADERPNVFLTFEGTTEPETFSPYRLNDKGTSKKQWNDLGVTDALSGTDIENLSTTNRGELDYENLLEIDPDVILVRGHERKTPEEFRDTVLAYMEDHPVGGELAAVQNGRVYRGGYLFQGPIHNLFLTERAAKQLYPDVFGDVTDDAELFDRQRVADIVNGEF